MGTSKRRNSSFELMRILCMLGIACMHALSPIWVNPRFVYLSNAENSLFQVGVTCFILVSGYFGVKWSFPKFLRFNLLAVFAGFLSLAFNFSATHSLSKTDLFKTLFPVFTARWWFLSCYICLMMLAPFLEKLLDRLSRQEFQILLAVLILWFYVSPTFLFFQLMNDSGKGLANFLTVYLIGRYIYKYHGASATAHIKALAGGGGGHFICGHFPWQYFVYESF